MNSFPRLVFIGVAVILAFNVVAAFASEAADIGYSWFSLGSFLLYATIGFLGAPRLGIGRALAASLIVAICEGTAGWWISWTIGPGRVRSGELSFTALIVSGVLGALIVGGVGGLLGSWIGLKTTST